VYTFADFIKEILNRRENLANLGVDEGIIGRWQLRMRFQLVQRMA
jgi:hypothetical protein